MRYFCEQACGAAIFSIILVATIACTAAFLALKQEPEYELIAQTNAYPDHTELIDENGDIWEVNDILPNGMKYKMRMSKNGTRKIEDDIIIDLSPVN